MNAPIIRIVFRHMDSTSDMENHINKQLKKVIEFLGNEPTPIYIDLVMTPSKVHAHHEIELLIKSPEYHVVVKKEGADFYLLLDKVIDAAYDKLHEEKRQKIDERKEQRPDKHLQEEGEYSKRRDRLDKKEKELEEIEEE